MDAGPETPYSTWDSSLGKRCFAFIHPHLCFVRATAARGNVSPSICGSAELCGVQKRRLRALHANIMEDHGSRKARRGNLSPEIISYEMSCRTPNIPVLICPKPDEQWRDDKNDLLRNLHWQPKYVRIAARIKSVSHWTKLLPDRPKPCQHTTSTRSQSWVCHKLFSRRNRHPIFGTRLALW